MRAKPGYASAKAGYAKHLGGYLPDHPKQALVASNTGLPARPVAPLSHLSIPGGSGKGRVQHAALNRHWNSSIIASGVPAGIADMLGDVHRDRGGPILGDWNESVGYRLSD